MTRAVIAVPVDGSTFAEWALPMALKLASVLRASLEVFSVYDDEPAVGGWPLSPERVRQTLDEYQDELVARIAAASDVPVAAAVVGGSVGKTVVEYIQRSDPLLVVMSTHGRGPLSRAWMGSVADRVIRFATMPVLLVRPEEEGTPDCASPPPLQTLLVALDGSERAEAGLEWATRLGRAVDASYVIVRAVPEPHVVSSYLPHTIKERERALERGRIEADEYLTAVRDRLADAGYDVRSEVSVGGSVSGDILRLASHLPADLVVVTTHGRSGLARVVLGSVSDKVVRGADRPVLVIRTVEPS